MLERYQRAIVAVAVRLAWLMMIPAAFAGESLNDTAKEAIARFARQIGSDVEADSIGSITAAVVIGNEIVWAEAFGWADRDKQIRATTETIYRVGSISKSITAVVMMQQMERGAFKLDDPVADYFPAIEHFDTPIEGLPPITFRQLASHTAGLNREPKLQRAAAGPIEIWEDKILLSIPTTSFHSLPGTKYAYSNIGFGVLGLAVSRASKQSFMALVHELIFDPLGMTSSTFIPTPEQKQRMSVGYANSRNGTDTELPARELAGRGYKVPNGGVYSTVGDLARFIASQTGVSPVAILSEEGRKEMQRVQTPQSETDGYGLGFSIRHTEGGHRAIGHGGSVAGHNAYITFDPESTIGVIMLRNYNRGETNLGRSAMELLNDLVSASRN